MIPVQARLAQLQAQQAQQPQKKTKEPVGTENIPRTRCGYIPHEVVQGFQKAICEAGTFSTGRVLHFAADIVASGGISILVKLLWEYALLHIGIASPRIFVYLKQRLTDIDELTKRLPDEALWTTEDFQIRIGEIILVLREAPTRSIMPWPKVGPETHEESWIRGAITDPVTETAVVRKVWRPEGDMPLLRTAGAQLCKAINDGSTEKALFWLKWLLEEEVMTRKYDKSVLSTSQRGPANLTMRQRTDVSFFVIHLYAEMYKEFAAKQLVRMNEEFQTLLDMWKVPPKGVAGSARKQILVVLTQILSEVPRWKVPAAPTLIKDPVFLSRAVTQTPKFFKEVLAYAAPANQNVLVKYFTKGKSTVEAKVVVKAKQKDAAEEKMSALDQALDDYFNR